MLTTQATLKCNFLRLSIAQVEIRQIPHVNFEMTNQFLLNFAWFYIVMAHNSFVNLKLIHFLLSIIGFRQSPNFETFKYSGENLPNSSCHFPNCKSVFLQILHRFSVSWNITPLYFFSSNIIYLGEKEHKKVQFFETSDCSSENSSCSSCQFWNNKLISVQNLHHSSLSWHITSL